MFIKECGHGDGVLVAFHGWGGSHRGFVPPASRLPLAKGARQIASFAFNQESTRHES